MNFYRDKITVNGETIRANVYVASTDTKLSGSGTDFLNMTVITVTIPPSRGKKLPVDLGRLQWRGLHFFVQGQVVPIMALGRGDHFQITATTAGGGGENVGKHIKAGGALLNRKKRGALLTREKKRWLHGSAIAVFSSKDCV